MYVFLALAVFLCLVTGQCPVGTNDASSNSKSRRQKDPREQTAFSDDGAQKPFTTTTTTTTVHFCKQTFADAHKIK